MAISYNKLWKLLIDKKMTAAELRKAADIAPNTLTRMKKDQKVSMQVLERMCSTLHADFGEIVEKLWSTILTKNTKRSSHNYVKKIR